jgi:hypothetical protein
MDITAIFGLGLIGVIMFVVIVVAAQAFFFRYETAYQFERIHSQVSVELRQLRAEQLERLQGYRWVNQQEGRVSIPIERAMELVAGGQARPGGPAQEAPGDEN